MADGVSCFGIYIVKMAEVLQRAANTLRQLLATRYVLTSTKLQKRNYICKSMKLFIDDKNNGNMKYLKRFTAETDYNAFVASSTEVR